ncbi:MAG TPA: thermonuclease family protein [Acidimicrobiales bacterium]|nr:thermonuclease family protein [Acidimicrobiales bacterium]
MVTLAIVAALVLPACTGGTRSTGRPPSGAGAVAGRIVVTKEVDGDTIRVRIGGAPEERVRFIGVDTPETHGPGGLRECFGQEAARRTAELIPIGTEVRLVRDAEARDKYGRLLAYVYRARDGLFVNLSLAQEGFAAALTIPPNVAHADEFVKAAADARTAGRGLWGRCGGPDTPITQQSALGPAPPEASLRYRRGP